MHAVDAMLGDVDRRKPRAFIRLITVVMVFAPFTQLRVWRIGITEVCSLLIVAQVLLSNDTRVRLKGGPHFVFTKFWVVFILLSSLGLGLNYLVLPYPSGTVSSMLFDLTSYALNMLVCFGIEASIWKYTEVDLWDALRKVFLWTSSILLALFLVSRFRSSIFGFSITHYARFRPLAQNVHHVSMIVAPLSFTGLRALVLEKRIVHRVLLLVLVVSDAIITVSMGALKGVLGLLVGAAASVLIMLYRKVSDRRLRVCLLLLAVAVSLLVFCLYAPQITQLAVDFFQSQDIGGGRQWLYRVSVEKVLRSPVVGYGPGAHVDSAVEPDANADSHQTFLTVALQGGLFAVAAYIVLHYRIFLFCVQSPGIFGAYVSILVYALGGDIMRRLPMWVFLMLLYYSRVQIVNGERQCDSRCTVGQSVGWK